MKITTVIALVQLSFLLCATLVLAQQDPRESHKGIHQLQSEYYRTQPSQVADSNAVSMLPLRKHQSQSALGYKVVGWYPYWSAANTYQQIDYSALTAIAYFSYEVDTATGSYDNLHEWFTTPLIAYAHARGVKLLLTVTNFGAAENNVILSNQAKRLRLADSIVAVVKRGGGDGVNIDFEAVSSAQRSNLVTFMQDLTSKMHSAVPGSEVSMASPAVDWSNAWDLAQLSQICDYLIVMGYDYFWSSSANAGPTAPLYGLSYNVSKSVTTYLNAGVPAGKLLLGVPWYGFNWVVKDSLRHSPTIGAAVAMMYNSGRIYSQQYGRIFDTDYDCPWLKYQDFASPPQWHQMWYDDSVSLGMKYAFARGQHLGGIGIWALGYYRGESDAWTAIHAAFDASGVKPEKRSSNLTITTVGTASNEFAIQITLDTPSPVSIQLVDALGSNVETLDGGMLDSGTHTLTMPTARVANGWYAVRARTRTSVMTASVVIMH